MLRSRSSARSSARETDRDRDRAICLPEPASDVDRVEVCFLVAFAFFREDWFAVWSCTSGEAARDDEGELVSEEEKYDVVNIFERKSEHNSGSLSLNLNQGGEIPYVNSKT
jgi:hypothetical protein